MASGADDKARVRKNECLWRLSPSSARSGVCSPPRPPASLRVGFSAAGCVHFFNSLWLLILYGFCKQQLLTETGRRQGRLKEEKSAVLVSNNKSILFKKKITLENFMNIGLVKNKQTKNQNKQKTQNNRKQQH